MNLDYLDRLAWMHVERGLANHCLRHGRDFVPASIPRFVADIGEMLKSPQLANLVDNGTTPAEDEWVSYEVAAQRLGVSRRVFSRLVADGTVDVVGHRVVVASLDPVRVSLRRGRPRRQTVVMTTKGVTAGSSETST